MTQSMKDLLQQIVDTFGEAIENDEEINGADAVDQIVGIYHQVKGILSAEASGSIEENKAGRVVVFADHGITRAVAVQGFTDANAPTCVVVDYDNCEGGKEAFERELIGVTREEFNRGCLYIW